MWLSVESSRKTILIEMSYLTEVHQGRYLMVDHALDFKSKVSPQVVFEGSHGVGYHAR